MPTQTVVRIASYNILHGLGWRDGSVDLAPVAATLAELDADVIALQEVDRRLPRTGWVDQVAWLAERLGGHGVFAPAVPGDPETSWTAPPVGYADDPDGPGYGVAIVTRLPIRRVRRRVLPGGGAGRRRPTPSNPRNPGWDHEPRVAVRVDVATAAGTLAITTTHLSYLPWRGLAQLRAAAHLAADGRGPAVLTGDLNLPPWPVRLVLPTWRQAGGEPTFPAWDPRRQIDQFLTRGRLRIEALETRPPGPSDHLPVVAAVRL